MKMILKKILAGMEGTVSRQNMFRQMFTAALRGMNYGNGGDFKESGELEALSFIKRQYPPGYRLTVFDVGANIGDYASAMSEFFRHDVSIYAFEPSAATFAALQENVRMRPNITPVNIGMSDVPGEVTLYKNSGQSGLSSVYQRRLDHFDLTMDQQETIRLGTVDSFCAERGITKIDFLKIDIEGNELKALNGAKTMIGSGSIDFIQFEFGGCNIDSRTFFQDFFYLLNDRYVIYRIVKDGLVEIKNYSESLEIFITINYLAMKRTR